MTIPKFQAVSILYTSWEPCISQLLKQLHWLSQPKCKRCVNPSATHFSAKRHFCESIFYTPFTCKVFPQSYLTTRLLKGFAETESLLLCFEDSQTCGDCFTCIRLTEEGLHKQYGGQYISTSLLQNQYLAPGKQPINMSN